MLIVALVSSLTAAMVWRQFRAVQIESADRARAQSSWILQGALDWARLILREDARANENEAVDHLGEVWAVPLAEARLSTFLAADKNNAEDGPEAFLSGSVLDAQAQYNLYNLLGGEQTPPEELRTLTRLCESVGVPPDTAQLISKQLRAAYMVKMDNLSSTPVRPMTISQLSWLGVKPEVLERLRPLITLLPRPTPVNINTASREVIAALFDGMDLATAQRLVQIRQTKPFRTGQDIKEQLPPKVAFSAERGSVNSSYFIITGKLRLDERVLEERSLVYRKGRDIQIVSRERVNQVLERSP